MTSTSHPIWLATNSDQDEMHRTIARKKHSDMPVATNWRSVGMGQGRKQQADFGYGLGQLLHDCFPLLCAERISCRVHIRNA